MSRSGADECGWRRYPAAGEMRCESESPEHYATADFAERLMNSDVDGAILNAYLFDIMNYGGVTIAW